MRASLPTQPWPHSCAPCIPPPPARLLLEIGPRACLERLPAALDSLASFLQESIAGPPPFGGGVKPLKARILQVASASPLLQWAQQLPPPPPAAQGEQQQQEAEAGSEQQGQDAGGSSTPGDLSPRASEVSDQYAELSLRLTSLLQLSPSKPGGGGAPVDDSPYAAAAAGCSRAAALVQTLSEMQVDAQLSGRPGKRRVAVVASKADAVAAVQGMLAAAPELAGTQVLLMRDAPEEEEELPAQQLEPEAAEQQLAAAFSAAAAKAAAAAAAASAADGAAADEAVAEAPAVAEAAQEAAEAGMPAEGAGAADEAAAEAGAAEMETAGAGAAEEEGASEVAAEGAAFQLPLAGGLVVHLLQVRGGVGEMWWAICGLPACNMHVFAM